MNATGAGGAVAAADAAPMGLDLDLEDGGVIGAREVGERLAARRAALLVGGPGHFLRGGRQVAMVAAAVSGAAPLLAARSSAVAGGRRRVGVGARGWRGAVGVGGRDRGWGREQLIGTVACFGTAAEMLLPEEAKLGFEFGDALAESRLALTGALMHGLPVADLLAQGESFGLSWASITRGGADGRHGMVRQQQRREVKVAVGGNQTWRGNAHAPVCAARSCTARSVATVLPISY
jgi:hypothetical protein